jgi:hypothetical protein
MTSWLSKPFHPINAIVAELRFIRFRLSENEKQLNLAEFSLRKLYNSWIQHLTYIEDKDLKLRDWIMEVSKSPEVLWLKI